MRVEMKETKKLTDVRTIAENAIDNLIIIEQYSGMADKQTVILSPSEVAEIAKVFDVCLKGKRK